MAIVYRADDLIVLEIDEMTSAPCPDGREGNPGEPKEHIGQGTAKGPTGIWRCETCGGLGIVPVDSKNRIRFHLRPWDFKFKMKLLALTTTENGQESTDTQNKAVEAIRHTVKNIEGVFTKENKPYELQFIDGNREKGLTDECVSDLLNLEQSAELVTGCLAFQMGIPTKMTKGGKIDPHSRFLMKEQVLPN
jgi:hypothetical protein